MVAGKPLQNRWTWVLFALGVTWTMCIVVCAPDDIFYSGDGGLKYLLVEQIASGKAAVTLELEAAEWVQDLWEAGYYPFGPPFVYATERGHLAAFPLASYAVHLPGYVVLGFKGFYVVPLVALWLLWAWFIRSARRYGLSTQAITCATGLLILTTPLSLYGAMIWEHTLGALLIFAAVICLFEVRHGLTARRAAALGLVAGFAPWVRSESYCLLAALAVVMLSRKAVRRQRTIWIFFAVVAVVVAVLWGMNTMLYGHPLGAHAYQILEDSSLQRQAVRAGRLAYNLAVELFVYFPPLIGLLVVMLLAKRSKDGIEARLLEPALVVTALALGSIALIVPHEGGRQFGPRFLLGLFPLLCLAAGEAYDRIIPELPKRRRLTILALMSLCAAGGLFINGVVGSREVVQQQRHRALPTLSLLKQRGERSVVVTHQQTAQELAASANDKAFFWVKKGVMTPDLAAGLLAVGERAALLITWPWDLPAEDFRFGFQDASTSTVEGSFLGRYDIYNVFRLALVGGARSTD